MPLKLYPHQIITFTLQPIGSTVYAGDGRSPLLGVLDRDLAVDSDPILQGAILVDDDVRGLLFRIVDRADIDEKVEAEIALNKAT